MLEVEHEVDRAESRDLWTFLTTEEIERVRRCEGIPPEVRSLLTVAIFTGLRKGELWGLHWRDVRLDGPMPEITVRFSHKGPTKSGKVRRVPLLAPALAELQAHRERAGNPPGDALVFPGPDGGHRHASYDAGWAGNTGSRSKPAWPGYRAAAGIRPEVRFHDLRHTCASHLVMGTWGRQWTLQEVAQFLGHSDIKVTQIYAHLSPDHLHRAAQGTPGGMAPTLTPTAVQAPESTQRAVGVMIRSKNFTSAP
jgi:integrase